MQTLSAVPKSDAAVGVGASGEADDYGIPVVGLGQLSDEDAEINQLVVHLKADGRHALVDDSACVGPHAVARVCDHSELNFVAVAVFPYAVGVGVHPAEVVQDPVGRVNVVVVLSNARIVEVPRGRAYG